jgi:hypothetical protein
MEKYISSLSELISLPRLMGLFQPVHDFPFLLLTQMSNPPSPFFRSEAKYSVLLSAAKKGVVSELGELMSLPRLSGFDHFPDLSKVHM